MLFPEEENPSHSQLGDTSFLNPWLLQSFHPFFCNVHWVLGLRVFCRWIYWDCVPHSALWFYEFLMMFIVSFGKKKQNKLVLAISHFISIQILTYLKYSESLQRSKNWNAVISYLGLKRGIMKLLHGPSASAHLCKLPSQKRDALFSGLPTPLQVP